MNPRHVAAAVVIVAGLFAIRAVRERRSAKPAPKGMQVPALQAGDDEALVLAAVTERQPGQRHIRLLVDGGEVSLTLRDAETDEHGMGFGKAVLEPSPERTKGAALVTAVARWLHQPAPAAGAEGELRPFPMGYVRLGAQDGWEANKLFFEHGKRYAEVFLNLSADGRKARLIEKDQDYRVDLVAVLGLLVRDGAPARRSPDRDPLVASTEPLFGETRELAGAEGVRELVALPEGFLGRREDGAPGKRASELLLWTSPREAPRRLAQLDGVVNGMNVGPGGKACVLTITYPKEARTISSADPGVQAVLDLGSGAVTKLEGSARYHLRLGGIFSPDSGRVALAADQGADVYDVSSGALLASAGAELKASPLAWDHGGLLLTHIDYGKSDETTTTTYFRWQPGGGKPRRVAQPPLESPDGRYLVETTKGGLTIRGPGGSVHQVSPSREEDQESLHTLTIGNARWIGPRQVLVELDEPMALDVAAGKLHFLVAGGGLRFAGATADGRLLVARDDRDRFVWAERR